MDVAGLATVDADTLRRRALALLAGVFSKKIPPKVIDLSHYWRCTCAHEAIGCRLMMSSEGDGGFRPPHRRNGILMLHSGRL